MTEENVQISQPALAQSEVREVLQYVPIFSGQTFVVTLDGKALSDMMMAEVLLDLISLQKIGVRLVIVYSGESMGAFLDWSAEVELKLSQTDVDSVSSVLKRGQAALISDDGELFFGKGLVDLARSVDAQKVLHLGHVDDYPEQWGGALHYAEADSVFNESEGLGYWVLQAVSGGVPRVHLLDGEMPGCLSRELFSNEGVGVMIYRDSYQEVRAISEEDIPELLAIIGRSVRSQHLLPRNYEEIEAQMEDYFVMAIDGNVVGSVALHPYDGGVGELACLFVKESHKGLGYGQALVAHVEVVAQERKMKSIFALSTAAGGFFERQMGYDPISLDMIPQERYQKLEESCRNSVALMKDLVCSK